MSCKLIREELKDLVKKARPLLFAISAWNQTLSYWQAYQFPGPGWSVRLRFKVHPDFSSIASPSRSVKSFYRLSGIFQTSLRKTP